MTDASARTGGDRRTVAPYGSWTSPLTAQLVAESAIGLGALRAVGGDLFWLELRPTEGGRSALVRRSGDGAIADVTPPGANVRTLVHEYGGGAYAVFARADGGITAIYSEFEDQRLYRLDLDENGRAGTVPAPGRARPITPAPPAPRSVRYADATVSPDGLTLLCVRERHEADEVVNELVSMPADGSAEPRVVAGGHDFYAAPRLSPDGRRLAWLSWDHPRMPWDGTELWVADVTAAGGLAAERLVAGGPEESVVQPAWSADGRLHFVSDRSGWWNLYRVVAESGAGPAEALAPAAAEFAGPSWVFGLQSYAFRPDGSIVAFFSKDGAEHLCLLDEPADADSGDGGSTAAAHEVTPMPSPLTTFGSVALLGGRVAAIAGSPTRSLAIVLIDLHDGAVTELRSSRSADVDPGYLSTPEPIEFPTGYEEGSVRGPLAAELAAGPLTAHALYYPPANRDFAGPAGERPPLIVISHGGPTSSTTSALALGIQFWTSRGIAVVDVDYGGSSGYGRAYRRRLTGNWGVVDTVDCINAARYLAARGDVDADRLAIRGGSAGGYTTLNALTRHSVFAAGASYFGLADLEAFASGGTHKFESQYLVGLVGPYSEDAAIYRERSPIHHVTGISCPVILFQGLEDAIVPPAQAEVIVEALRQKGLPYAYLAFEGEQHGFRRAENIARTLEAELYFYGRVFGFSPSGDVEPVEIENLD
jgi:dipeptidyl aminopeptidase/acylaminoacyl peptidase